MTRRKLHQQERVTYELRVAEWAEIRRRRRRTALNDHMSQAGQGGGSLRSVTDHLELLKFPKEMVQREAGVRRLDWKSGQWRSYGPLKSRRGAREVNPGSNGSVGWVVG